MKISRSISRIKGKNNFGSAGRVKQGADRRIAANSANGTGQFALAAPSGIIYIPNADEDAVVVSTDSGQICIGVRIPYNTYNLNPGELMLYSAGGATIFLKNDGKVIINGKEF